MTQTYAAKVPLPAGPGSLSSGDGWEDKSQLAFCLSMGGPVALKIFVERVLSANIGSAKTIEDQLMPLLEQLLLLAQKHNLSESSEPFASAIRQVLFAWTSHVLGPRPCSTAISLDFQPSLDRFTCACVECTRVRSFLLLGNTSTELLHGIGAVKRKHVEQQLTRHLNGFVSYKLIVGTPQGLSVRKPLRSSNRNHSSRSRGL
jgi:hypothetical protein